MSYIFLCAIGIILGGQGFSTNSVLLGHAVDIFLNYEHKTRISNITSDQKEFIDSDFMYIIYNLFIISLIFSFISLLGSYIMIYYSQISMIVLSKKMREVYFRNIVRMEMAWHDRQSSGEYASKIATDFKRFENGFNENVAVFLFHVVAAILNLMGAFFYGFKLTFSIVFILPIIIFTALCITKVSFNLDFL